MPKNRVRTKTANGAIINSRPCSKFRIGNRKSGKSALLMTTEELLKVLTDDNKKRYRPKAHQVLVQRGVNIEAALATETA